MLASDVYTGRLHMCTVQVYAHTYTSVHAFGCLYCIGLRLIACKQVWGSTLAHMFAYTGMYRECEFM